MQARNDVVIVGGGPIGLATAIGIKHINPELNVIIHEKYDVYQRSHTLQMEHDKLQQFMQATGTQEVPELVALHKRLVGDKHIRTNELEEILKQLAKDKNIKIVIGEVTDANIRETLCPEGVPPKLVIGADGTHSRISRSLFPEGNQVKHEFDYVLQFRFDIEGKQKPKALSNANLLPAMLRHGLIANEYVGNYDEKTGRTTVTMQMMITQDAFYALKDEATSKTPIYFGHELNMTQVPAAIGAFLTEYTRKRMEESKEDRLVPDSMRVSVNEAPATHAREVYTRTDQFEGTLGLLVGDAALGLSYFKGLNAGVESSAKLFTCIADVLRQGLTDTAAVAAALQNYQVWFDTFAQKKVKEVADYSAKRINRPWKFVSAVRSAKLISGYDHADGGDAINPALMNFINFTQLDAFAEYRKKHPGVVLFPHRQYEPTSPFRFSHISIRYSLNRMAKMFVDFIKPYKSKSQALNDFKQPFLGGWNIFRGTGKIALWIFFMDIHMLSDGLFTLARGLLEVAMAPVTWILKPLARGMITGIEGKPKIENNPGIRKVAEKGLAMLESHSDEPLSDVENFQLHAISNDLYRKFIKAEGRGQRSDIADEQYAAFWQARTAGGHTTAVDFKYYFTLFTGGHGRREPMHAEQGNTIRNRV